MWPGSGVHFREAMTDLRADDYDTQFNGNRFAWLGDGFSQTEKEPSKGKYRKVLTRKKGMSHEPDSKEKIGRSPASQGA